MKKKTKKTKVSKKQIVEVHIYIHQNSINGGGSGAYNPFPNGTWTSGYIQSMGHGNCGNSGTNVSYIIGSNGENGSVGTDGIK